ncbi:MAG: TAT-variant-translocated molybdopterin oxidoreductase, partial [Gemmataceae bacterium]
MASAKIEASAPESISPETMGLVTETPTGEPKFWRSLEEYAGEKNFDEMVQREFPRFAAEFTDPVSRRKFIGLMGASLALASMTGCRQPSGTVVPNVVDTEGVIQGKP